LKRKSDGERSRPSLLGRRKFASQFRLVRVKIPLGGENIMNVSAVALLIACFTQAVQDHPFSLSTEVRRDVAMEALAYIPNEYVLLLRSAKSVETVNAKGDSLGSFSWKDEDQAVFEDGCRAIAVSPNGTLLAIAAEGHVHLWRRERKQRTNYKWIYWKDIWKEDSRPRGLSFSRDGAILACGARQAFAQTNLPLAPVMRTWKISEPSVGEFDLAVQHAWRDLTSLNVFCTALSADGRLVAFGGADFGKPLTKRLYAPGILLVFDSTSGRLIRRVTSLHGRVTGVTFIDETDCIALAPSANSELAPRALAAINRETGEYPKSAVVVLDTKSGRTTSLNSDRFQVFSVCATSQGKYLFASTNDGILYWKDMNSESRSVLPGSEGAAFHALALSTDGEHIAGSDEGRVLIWKREKPK
jgi:WD40 repeat protein